MRRTCEDAGLGDRRVTFVFQNAADGDVLVTETSAPMWRYNAQLERAVSIVLEQLKEHPAAEPRVPRYPNYHEHDGLGTVQ